MMETTSVQLERQLRGKCRHFNGVQNETCKAGVSYDSLSVKGYGIPCVASAKDHTLCAHYEALTEQEIAEEIAWEKAEMAKFEKAMPLINRIKREHKRRDATGEEPCPACRIGMLRWSHSAINGHVHGCCSTEGCLSWME